MKVITLSGPSSSGKTTVAKAFVNTYNSDKNRIIFYQSEIRKIASDMNKSLDLIMADMDLNRKLQTEFTKRMILNIEKAFLSGYDYFITDRGIADGIVYYFLHGYDIKEFGYLLSDRMKLIKYIDYIVVVPPFTDKPLKYDDDITKSDLWLVNQDKQADSIYYISSFIKCCVGLSSMYNNNTVIKKLDLRGVDNRAAELAHIAGINKGSVNLCFTNGR